MPKKKRSKSPVKTDRPKYKELTSAESRHIALWESLAGRVPPFRMKQVVEQNVKSPRAISEVSTRLARQAAEYEASALFQVAADKYHRSAKYRMEEQDRQASATAQEHAYQEKQRAMRQREEEERLEAKHQLSEYSRQVAEDAEVRRQKKIEMMQVRERRAAQRLREQAQLAREEEEAERLKPACVTSAWLPRCAARSSSSMKSSGLCAGLSWLRASRDDLHSDGAHPSSDPTVL